MKKLLVCLLALLMVIPFMVACGGDADDNQSKSSSSGDKDALKTPVVDLGGREINILCWDFGAGNKSIKGFTGEIMYDENSSNSVDIAKKEVVSRVQELYNCKIVGTLTSNTNEKIPAVVKEQVQADNHEFDICFDNLAQASTLALEKFVLDLNTVPGIDLKASWWDQNAVKDLSIGGKVYFTCGDINTFDDQGTWVILFNKTLKEKQNIEENFYELVDDNKWTYDKFVEICTKNKVTHDSNGDNTLDELDTWAYGGETFNIYVHLVAAGMKIANKDEVTDLPYLTVSTEAQTTYSALTKILEFYNDQNTVMIADSPLYASKFPWGTYNPFDETVHKAFIEGRELFYMGGLFNLVSLRDMAEGQEFGILPIPKNSATQDRYYHTVSHNNASVMFLPASIPASDLNNLGHVISALGELSEKQVTPEFYDVQLKYRDARDDESGRMLDLIFDSRSFDLGAAYNWGADANGWGGILGQYMNLDPNVASRFESVYSKAQVALNDMLAKIK
jgi:hypothetical protein